MWRGILNEHGIIAARVVAHHYLNVNAGKSEMQQSCEELREVMAAAENSVHVPIYLHSEGFAELDGKTDIYTASIKAFAECGKHIDLAVQSATITPHEFHYDLAVAALVDHHGFDRLELLLKCAVLHDLPFRRFSEDIYAWAKDFKKPDHFGNFDIRTPPAVLAGLIEELRRQEAVLKMEEKNVFTLDELIERMEPQSQIDKAIMRDCIEGLGVYAASKAVDNHIEAKTKEMRDMVETLASYWCLDDGPDAKSIDEFLQEFDDKVDTAIRSDSVDADYHAACANTLTGLARYGEELNVAQGNDAMGEMLKVADLLEEVGEYFGYSQELEFAQGSAKWLRNTVDGMLAEYDFPGSKIDGDSVQNYIVKRAVMYDNNVGFVFAHNPEAASPFVTWRTFTTDNKTEYEWGHYYLGEAKALVDYIDRAKSYAMTEKVQEKPLPTQAEALETKPLIRFIDSEYRELFNIPDGESIRITYPPGDGREPAECVCKRIDEMHTKIGRDTYHICEFAEKNGAYRRKI
jgi:hypothetical protein